MEQWREVERVNITFGSYPEIVAHLKPYDAHPDYRLEPDGQQEIVVLKRVAVRGQRAA